MLEEEIFDRGRACARASGARCGVRGGASEIVVDFEGFILWKLSFQLEMEILSRRSEKNQDLKTPNSVSVFFCI